VFVDPARDADEEVKAFIQSVRDSPAVTKSFANLAELEASVLAAIGEMNIAQLGVRPTPPINATGRGSMSPDWRELLLYQAMTRRPTATVSPSSARWSPPARRARSLMRRWR